MKRWNPNGGTPRWKIDAMEKQVTPAMIERARLTREADGAPFHEAKTRRNIAIGLACGSYKPE